MAGGHTDIYPQGRSLTLANFCIMLNLRYMGKAAHQLEKPISKFKTSARGQILGLRKYSRIPNLDESNHLRTISSNRKTGSNEMIVSALSRRGACITTELLRRQGVGNTKKLPGGKTVPESSTSTITDR